MSQSRDDLSGTLDAENSDVFNRDHATQEARHAERTDADLRATFTRVIAEVCTPVSVVTAMDGDRPHGTTVSAARDAEPRTGPPLTYHARPVFRPHSTFGTA